MPKYAILSEESFKGQILYFVLLQAEDGTIEEQEYVGNISTIEKATIHFDSTWKDHMVEKENRKNAVKQDPIFIEVSLKDVEASNLSPSIEIK